MKKNITINLCGRLFQIDEDAYEMLQHYTESLRASFGKEEGGEEIADDIEERIAELFDELKANGVEAITIDHVKDIITRIGKPEQLTGEDDEEESGARPKDACYQRDARKRKEEGGKKREESGHRYDSFQSAANGFSEQMKARVAGKKLYRNPFDKMLAGVLSGFAAYTGTDAIWWRIGYVVLFLASFSVVAPILKLLHIGFFLIPIELILIVLYIVLAIVIPEAKMPQQVLQMKGQEVTPQSLADVVIDKQPVQQRSTLGTVFSVLLKILFGIFVAIAIIICFFLCICFLFLLIVTITALVFPNSGILYGVGMEEIYHDNPWVLAAFGASLFVLLLIPIYAIIHMVMSLAGKVKPMSIVQRIVWIALWLLALCCLVPCSIKIADCHNKHIYERNRVDYAVYQGAYMEMFDCEYLSENGWQLLKHENCNDSYVRSGEHFSGNRNRRYLDAWNALCVQVYQVEKSISVEPGQYRVSCNARAEGHGVYIYATTPSSTQHPIAQTEIPAYGNTGGEIWEAACGALESDSLMDNVTRKQQRDIRNANNGKGYGWSKVEVMIDIEKPEMLCFGLSTDPMFTGHPHESEWFSACDFKVERIEKKDSK